MGKGGANNLIPSKYYGTATAAAFSSNSREEEVAEHRHVPLHMTLCCGSHFSPTLQQQQHLETHTHTHRNIVSLMQCLGGQYTVWLFPLPSGNLVGLLHLVALTYVHCPFLHHVAFLDNSPKKVKTTYRNAERYQVFLDQEYFVFYHRTIKTILTK